MHYISILSISNFRSVKKANFTLAPYTPLVGYNNAGKSNIVRALNWMVKKTSLSSDDFNDQKQPVVVECEIAGISEDILASLDAKHRDRIVDFVCEDKIRFRRSQAKPGDSVTKISFEVQSPGGEWSDNPNGIDNAIIALLPEPILVGAMEDAAEDVGKYGASTTIGKLLKEILADVTNRYGEQVENALAEVRSAISANGENKDDALRKLDGRIDAELRQIFLGVTAKIDIATPQISDFIKSATIKLFDNFEDNQIARDVRSMGHGAQRSAQIALIKCLAEAKKTGNPSRTTLLLIDEPELYLHPHAIEQVRSALKSLSAQGYQVVFSTHSPILIKREDAANVLLIRRDKVNGTYALPTLGATVEKEIADAETQAEIIFAIGNSSRILFSDRVVLVEGETELAVLPNIAHYHIGKSFEEQFVAVVGVRGSTSIPKSMKVLRALGIKCKAVADLDFAFQVCYRQGLLDDVENSIEACKLNFVKLNGEGKISLSPERLPQKGVCSAEQAYALMANEMPDAIREIAGALQGQDIWVWTKGAIEAHLGLPDKRPATHAAFVEAYKSEEFRKERPDATGLAAMLTWAVS